MNTQIQIDSYYQHVNSGKKLKQREAILAMIKPKTEWTRREIAGHLGFELGATSGRVNKLVADGLLEECGTMKCPTTNKTVGLVRKKI